ncbi:MAG: DUF1244 domain-containing protein [Proteobacteria bacterium]|nr:DUF1244 domain-containing protein [Pseudomonadota bacterium]
MNDNVELEAAAFRRLLQHLNVERSDVQNIDLMILAGFCRNCLADWYREAAAERGMTLDKDAARERIYGEPYANWKAKYGREATQEQLFALALAETKHPRE